MNLRSLRTTALTMPSSRANKRVACCSMKDDYDRKSLFAARESDSTPTIAQVMTIVEEAERRFLAQSARVEYCRSKGINYENASKYLPHVASLSILIDMNQKVDAENSDEPHEPHAIKMRILGTPILIITPHGKCPICGDKHELSMCPMLPDDMRPFIRF